VLPLGQATTAKSLAFVYLTLIHAEQKTVTDSPHKSHADNKLAAEEHEHHHRRHHHHHHRHHHSAKHHPTGKSVDAKGRQSAAPIAAQYVILYNNT